MVDAGTVAAAKVLTFELRYATYTVAWAIGLTIIEMLVTLAIHPAWALSNRGQTQGGWSDGLCGRVRRAAENNRTFCSLFVLTLLISHNVGVHGNALNLACRLFLGCRIFHAIFYAIGLAPARTLAFFGSLFAFGLVVSQILGMRNVTVEQYMDIFQTQFKAQVYPHIAPHIKHLEL
eukprot:CFRG5401T1